MQKKILFITFHYYDRYCDDEYNIAESSLVQSSRKLFLLLFCNLVIGLLLSRSSNCMFSECFSSSTSLSRKKSINSNKKTSSGNISCINNQSASLIGLDDPLSYLSREAGYQMRMERQQDEDEAHEDYGNINDNSSSSSSFATVLNS